MKRILVIGSVFVVLFYNFAFGKANFNLTGQGARALGMGGAFIAIADDATAISWNPAGLAQLDRPEASVVGKFASEEMKWDKPGIFTSGDTLWILTSRTFDQSHFVLNFGSLAYPLKVKERNLVFAVAYQQQIDLFDIPDSNTTTTGGASTISPGVAYQIHPQFALGAAANIWMGSTNTEVKNWEKEGRRYNFTIKEPYSGLNFFVGGWGNVKPVKFGAIVRTPVTIKYHDEYSGSIPPNQPTRDPVSGEDKLKLPFMFGFGIAVTPTQNLTLAGDVDIRPYSSAEFQDSAGVKDTTLSKLQNVNQIRVGAEYLLTLGPGIVPLRVGFRTDPRTYTGQNLIAGGGMISDGKQVTGTVFTFGTGFVTPRFLLDGAFEYGTSSEPWNFDASYTPSGTRNWKETTMTFLVSGIIHF